jgi:hypothetical protein
MQRTVVKQVHAGGERRAASGEPVDGVLAASWTSDGVAVVCSPPHQRGR